MENSWKKGVVSLNKSLAPIIAEYVIKSIRTGNPCSQYLFAELCIWGIPVRNTNCVKKKKNKKHTKNANVSASVILTNFRYQNQ